MQFSLVLIYAAKNLVCDPGISYVVIDGVVPNMTEQDP